MKTPKHHFATLAAAASLVLGAAAIGIRTMQQGAPVAPAAAAAIPSPAPARNESEADRTILEASLATLRQENLRLTERSDQIVEVLAALGEQIDDLERRGPGEGPSPPVRESGESASTRPPPLDPGEHSQTEAEARERAEREIDARFDQLADSLSLEQADGGWSASAQRDIGAAVQNVADRGLALKAADCRSSFCRIQIDVDPSASEEEAFQAFQEIAPWSGEGIFSFQAGEGGGAVLYLAREGHRLPPAESAVR